MASILLLFCIVLMAPMHFTPIVESANVVFFSMISSYSHRVTMWPLAEALAEKGHNVTYISTYHAKKPNPKIYDYVPTKMEGWMDMMSEKVDIYDDRKNNKQGTSFFIPFFGLMMCNDLYQDEEFINYVKSVKVDLVFVDSLANECIYGAVQLWKSKIILFHTFSQMGYFLDAYGLPDESSWLPSLELYPVTGPEMTFSERMYNRLIVIVCDWLRKWIYFPRIETLAKEKLGLTDNNLKFEELERNTSMVFLNMHYSLEYPRSLPPNVIPVGGIAMTGQGKVPLPKELETFLNKGDGFIYISFGSWADFTRFDDHIKQAFINTMNNMPNVQFVFKVSNETLMQEFSNNNVYVAKWVPQQTLLTHPKIKAYVSQVGLISMQEAVYHEVPLICFPILCEQDYNAEIVHRKGFGISLEVTKVTQAELEDAINKILHDPKYKENIKVVSKLFKERPHNMKPLDTALYWTEFVIQHSHAELTALRPMGIHQSWWKKRGVDVWATTLGVTVFALTLLAFLTWKLLKRLCCRGSSTRKNEKQQNKKNQ